MDALLLTYNMVLLILYSLPLVFALFIYQSGAKKPLYIYVAILFLFYIFDNLVIYMTEFVSWFSTFYDNIFMTVPTFKTIVFTGTFFCMLKINELTLKRRNSNGLMACLLVLVAILLFIPMMTNSALKVWLYYFPCQVFTFTLSVYGLRVIKREPDGFFPESVTKQYRRLLIWTAVFAILIVIEDTLVIFNLDVYTDLMVKINNRSITEDIMSIYHSFFALRLLAERLQVKSEHLTDPNIETEEELPTDIPVSAPRPATVDTDSSVNEYSKFYLFCRKYQLTTREQDIMSLLLENKNNTDISEELYISIGTAKTHIHNIFTKLDIKKRSQLIERYNQFDEKTPDILQ